MIKYHFNDILTQIFNLDSNPRRNLRKHICTSTQTIWSRRFQIVPLSQTTNGAAKAYKGCNKKKTVGFVWMTEKWKRIKISPVCGDVPLCAKKSSVETEVDLEVDPFQQKWIEKRWSPLTKRSLCKQQEERTITRALSITEPAIRNEVKESKLRVYIYIGHACK